MRRVSCEILFDGYTTHAKSMMDTQSPCLVHYVRDLLLMPFAIVANFFSAPHFTGASYIKLVGWNGATQSFDLRLSIIPVQDTGIILYAGGFTGRGDFTSIILNKGYLEFR